MSESHESSAYFRKRNDEREYVHPIPNKRDLKFIEQFGEHLRRKYSFEHADHLPSLAHSMGGQIKVVPLGLATSSSFDQMVMEPDGSFVVHALIGNGDDEELRRDESFFMAKMIGHKYLHWGLHKEAFPGKGMKVPRMTSPDQETLQQASRQAAAFAFGFLLPAKEFTEVYKRDGIEAAGDKFGVSQRIIKDRIRDLGLEAGLEQKADHKM